MRSKTAQYFAILVLTIALPVSIYLLGQKTSIVNKAYYSLFGTKAKLTVNLTNASPQTSYAWSNFAQGGEEQERMLEPVAFEVGKLSPDYIRIDHIYDFYQPVTRDSGGRLVYDWQKLDAEIRIILATGAKPFISLSYTPSVLSTGSEVDMPNNLGEWQQIVRATIEHVSGIDNMGISEVYYEVWNEPDIFGEFKPNGAKDYLQLYKYAALGAQQATNTYTFKIGGPATTALYKNWFDSLFRFAGNNNLRLDFYSWHRYSLIINDFDDDIIDAKSWILRYPKYINSELVISEAGHDPKVNVSYDNAFSAVHTLALFASTYRKIPKIFSFELKDGPGPKQYWGRWGILTNEAYGAPIAKPRYHAFEFLNRMKGDSYTVYGQGTWVKAFSTSDAGVIRLLLVNYDPYGRHYENVPVNFVNLPYQNFIFRRNNFLGNVVDNRIENDGTNWSTLQLMEPNSAALFEIIPI
jgi:beta-xylosidase